MSRQYLLYGHGGSFNHGGEALVSTTITLLRHISPECKIILSTHFAQQDKQFNINANEFVERDLNGKSNDEIYLPTLKKITPDSVCIHLGGDNYCYRNWQRYALIHQKALEQGATSILWSCSIDPTAIDGEMLGVLRTHHLIAARESITYNTLVEHGLSNVVKVSDIAFTLIPQPIEFDLCNFVAINLSPLIIKRNPLVKNEFQRLCDYLIRETDLNIALIPHVVSPVDNDYDALSQLLITHENRVVLVSDKLSASQYKYIISKARFGVFARTHAAIAGYSSCVPTLAVGYSTKACGIACDLSMSDYAIDVTQVSNKNDIVNAFLALKKQEVNIKNILAQQMTQYTQRAVNERALQLIKD